MAVTSTGEPEEGASPETTRLRESIAESREHIGSTIDALQEKLKPATLVAEAKSAVREATIGKVENMVDEAEDTIARTSHSLWGSMRANPVPLAMAGIGLAWFFASRGRRGEDAGSSREGEGSYTKSMRSGSRAGGGFGAEGETSAGSGSNIGETAQKAKETVKRVAREATSRGREVERRLEDRFYDNPIAAGVVMMAAGTAVGLAIPISRKEEQWMGPARDRLVDKASEMAHEALGKVEETARKVEGVARDVGENVSQVMGEPPR